MSGDPDTLVVLKDDAYMDMKNVYYFHEYLRSDYTYSSSWKTVQSESHLRRMDAPELLIGKTRRERAKRGWIPLPK